MNLLVLVDSPEDGCCEGTGWVETTVDEATARELLAEFCFDEEGDAPFTPVGPAERQWLCPTEPDAPYEEQRWQRCDRDVEGAREFWQVIVS